MRSRAAPRAALALLSVDVSGCWPIWSVAGALPTSVIVNVLLACPPSLTEAVIEPGSTRNCPALSR